MSTTKSPGKPNVFTARPKRSRMRRVDTPPPMSRRTEGSEADAPPEARSEPEADEPTDE